jgi:NADH pyrophosphatase NudC (nudix superfamily)
MYAATIDGVERQQCEDCNYVIWENPVPVVAAIVIYKEQLVLARNQRWPQGHFSFITGYVEKNETPEQSAVREVQEELNLDTHKTRFLGHYIFEPKNQLLITYEIQTFGELQPGEELAEIKLVPQAAVAAYDFGPMTLTQQIINEWLGPGKSRIL